MSSTSFPPLEEIDRNFKGTFASPDLEWIDAFDSRLAIRGLAWVQEGDRSFRRVPERAVPSLSDAVQHLSRCPAGGFIAFRTNANEIAVRMANSDSTGMSHMPMTGIAGAELFIWEHDAWIPLAVAVPPATNPAFERRLVTDMGNAMREYRLYLPLYKPLQALCIGVTPGSKVEPVYPTRKPIVFYGTSISQGGCANTTGSDYVATVGRMMGYDALNFGFSGSGRGEPEVAQLLAEIDATMFVLGYSANCEPERLEATLPDFVRILRERHPVTPIVILSSISFTNARWDRALRQKQIARRDFQMKYYLEAKARGDLNLHFIDGEGLLPSGLNGTQVDGIHPTSAGFVMMAQNLVPQLQMILTWAPQTDCAAPLERAAHG